MQTERVIMRKGLITLFLSFLLLLISCAKKSENSLTSGQIKFLNVYTDLARLREKYSFTDSAFIDSSKIIFKRYDFSQEQFTKTLSEFRENPKQWETFFNEALQQIPKTKKISANPR